MFSRFFIDRPIFATVLSIVITLAGALSVRTLPLAQFPRISPPTVTVTANYPGASAQDVATAVAAPIEQYVNGVEGMMYMSSQCTNDGGYNLTVTFHQGIDLDMAQVLLQNRVTMALPSLPDVIKATGVATRKRSPDILMGIAVLSPNRRYDQLYLSNFALRRIKDELARLPGVGDVFLFGQRDFCMRVWLDPNKMTYRGLNASDVVRAIRDQNTEIATGMIGQPPNPPSPSLAKGGNGGGSPPLDKGGNGGVEMQLTVSTLGRLREVEQFENIIIRTTADGRVLRLKDVARIELGAKNQDVDTNMDGQPTVFLAIFQAPDGNALETYDLIMAKMEELKEDFPEDLAYDVGFTTVPYTRESIREVFHTLRDSIILVALVVLLFLQNWRSAIIPLIAVPVAIIGTFAIMAAFGFSLNNLTLFGLVLAIGIVVDDAIVVVEAVEHHIEEGLPPREAALAAMRQVSGPVIAVGLVLSAVFIPCAFISGITGLFFRQFALTISASTIISAVNSLTLSPALAALLLRPLPHKGAKYGATPPLPRWFYALAGAAAGYFYLAPLLTAAWDRVAELVPVDATIDLRLAGPWVAAASGLLVGWLASRPINGILAWLFGGFNVFFGWATHGYTSAVGKLVRFSVIVLIVYGGLVALTGAGFVTTAKGFIPSQDMGYLMVNVQLPDSASMERTREVMRQLDQITRRHPAVKHATTIAGQSFALQANGSNFGSMFVNLKEYWFRRDPSMSSDAVANWLRKEFGASIYDANVAVFGPPPVRGVGRAGGFAFVLEDRGDLGPQALQEYTDLIAREGNAQPGLLGLFSVFRANVPQLQVNPDLRELVSKGVSPGDFADALRTYQGSLYVNDFNLFGRTWQVVVQAEPDFRNRVEYLTRYTVRNSNGAMVPIGSVASVEEINGPLILNRHNMYPSATINGMAGPGLSSRQAIDAMQRLASQELPPALAYEWTDMSYLELQAGNTAMRIFGYAVMMVFMVLAAQYESWSLPLAVILVVPMCLLSAIIGVRLAGMDINIFTQIGFVVLVGLSSKNAILIVEYAKHLRESGVPRREATLQACRLRLRPIVMTSLAFILGVVPLMVSTGAGAEMRRTLGTAVFAGMLGVTLFGIFLTPVFFYVINQLAESHWLNSPAMRRVQEVSLGIFGLGYARRLLRSAVRRRNG